MTYLIIVSSAAALVTAVFAWRHWQWRQRERAIRALLDGADALQAQLQECRQRMHKLKEMIVVLPEEMSANAATALTADERLQAGLRDVLAHRLWIKQHAIDATQSELDAAGAALAQSRAVMATQIERLSGITGDLARAQSSAQSIGNGKSTR